MVNTGPVIASIRVEVPEGVSDIIEESLSPEVDHPSSKRSNVKVSINEGLVILTIEASDVVAMRATINSYLRWVKTILDVVDTIG